MKTLPVALQLYTVRDEAERDFAGTMEKVRGNGILRLLSRQVFMESRRGSFAIS